MKVLLVGKKGSGKSTLIYSLFKNYDCGGIVCLPVIEKGHLVGKDAIDMDTHRSNVFCRVNRKADFDGFSVGKYIIKPEGITFCIEAIKNSFNKDILLIDEVGPLEIQGKGFHGITHKVLKEDKNCVIILRKQLMDTFFAKFPYRFTILHFS